MKNGVKVLGVLALVCATLLLVSGAPRAEETLSPSTITLAQLLLKAKTARGTLAPGAYHTVLHGVANGETTVEESYFDGDGYETTESTADISSAWGSVNGRQWYRNANGFVQSVSGAYAMHDPIAVAVRKVNEGDDTGATLLGVSADPARYVVGLTPQDGLSEKRYYDADTFLLRKIVMLDYDGHTRTTTYDDYRSAFGSMVPFSRTYASDFYKEITRYQVVEYSAVAKSRVHLVIPASTSLFSLAGRDSLTIPADFSDRGIIVKMNVGQRGLDLLLDSGSSSIVVNAAVAADLGLALHDKSAESMGGIYATSDARINDVSIGPLHASTAVIGVAPWTDDVSPTERAVGLLGCDFIASGALQVDFASKTLTLYAKPPADLLATGWIEVPITLDRCVPLVKASFSGTMGQFIVDLGAYQTLLYDHFFSQFKASSAPPRGDSVYSNGSFIGGDEVKFQEYRMRTFGIGDLLFADALVMVPLTKRVQERDYDGLLGRSTLSSFKILFDYAGQRIYLKPDV